MNRRVKKTVLDTAILVLILIIVYFSMNLYQEYEFYSEGRENCTVYIDDISREFSPSHEGFFASYRISYRVYYENAEGYGVYHACFRPNFNVGDKMELEKLDFFYTLIIEIEANIQNLQITISSLILLFILLLFVRKKFYAKTIDTASLEEVEENSIRNPSKHSTFILGTVLIIMIEAVTAFKIDIGEILFIPLFIIMLVFGKYFFLNSLTLLISFIVFSVISEVISPLHGLEGLWYYFAFGFNIILILFAGFILWRYRKNKT